MEAIVLDRCDGINGVIELKAINLVTGNNDHRKNDLRLQKMPEEVIISVKGLQSCNGISNISSKNNSKREAKELIEFSNVERKRLFLEQFGTKRTVGHSLLQEFWERCKTLDNRVKQKCIVRPEARYFTTGIHILVILVATGILLDRGYICYSKYRTKESAVKQLIRQTSEGAIDDSLPFIDLIICPTYEKAFNDEMLRKYGIDPIRYRLGYFSPTNARYKNLNLQEIFNNITHSVRELLYWVKFTTLDRNNRTFVEDFTSTDDNIENFDVITKYTDTLGRCYSIRPRAHIVRMGIVKMDILARTDVFIYLGYPGQFMYNTKARVISRLGQRAYQDFAHELNLNTVGYMEEHRCDQKMNLNFDEYWYKHVAMENYNKFGCSVPWHPLYKYDDESEIRVCNNSNLGYKAAESFNHSKDAPISKDLVPCAMYNFNLGAIDRSTHDYPKTEAFVRLYLRREIVMKKMVIYYDKTTFAADIGGYVGMFLGVSVIDLAILFNSSFLVLIQNLYG